MLATANCAAPLPPLPRNTCRTYNLLAAGISKPGGTNKAVLTGSFHGIPQHMETPGKSTWIPNCAQDGSYARYQVRESGQKDAFCVAPQNGEIVFDPFPAARVAGNVSALPDPLYCDCLSKSREIILDSSTAADMQWILTCDMRTGFHNPLQRQPDSLVCFDQMGSRSNKEPPLCTKEGKTKLATTASSATFGHAH
ncbi:hypothetical protein BV898_08789 [Hypsibius exemplaris]|uniref:Thyroglobulin type-1 domain-containing protein n=1 Tax=Hypsibius exemplaris TaxID=2072580 RepID=A0A1W0WPF3_HYPEX|nr:hypothetical protein BV898_08789 [Hypsibius exemplaris]